MAPLLSIVNPEDSEGDNSNKKRRRKDREEADDLQLAPTTRRIQPPFLPSFFPPFPITKNSQPRRLRTIIITASTITKCKKKASNEEPGTKTSSSTSSWFTGTAASKSKYTGFAETQRLAEKKTSRWKNLHNMQLKEEKQI